MLETSGWTTADVDEVIVQERIERIEVRLAGVEGRVARVETEVGHLRADVSDMKGDIRDLSVRVDQLKDSGTATKMELKESIAAFKCEVKDWFAAVNLQIERLRGEMRSARAMDRVWWLLICASLLGVTARGFKWV